MIVTVLGRFTYEKTVREFGTVEADSYNDAVSKVFGDTSVYPAIKKLPRIWLVRTYSGKRKYKEETLMVHCRTVLPKTTH